MFYFKLNFGFLIKFWICGYLIFGSWALSTITVLIRGDAAGDKEKDKKEDPKATGISE